MLGELNVSQVSHGPCTHLSPFAIKQRRTDSCDIPFLAPLCAEGCWVCLPTGRWCPIHPLLLDSPLQASLARNCRRN